jgi:hypothetical protein
MSNTGNNQPEGFAKKHTFVEVLMRMPDVGEDADFARIDDSVHGSADQNSTSNSSISSVSACAIAIHSAI